MLSRVILLCISCLGLSIFISRANTYPQFYPVIRNIQAFCLIIYIVIVYRLSKNSIL